jgi:hypothetical protein
VIEVKIMSSIVYKNIFDAVTDNPEESLELQALSDLTIAIRDIIEELMSKEPLK